MEKLIKLFSDLKTGDPVIFPCPMMEKDVFGVVSMIMPSAKYPLGDQNGKMSRNYHDESGKLCNITAEEEGEDPETMKQVSDIWFEGGSFHVTDLDDVEKFNIRRIDENHPMYNPVITENVSMIGNFLENMGASRNE